MDGRPIASLDDLHRILSEEKINTSSVLSVLMRAENIQITVVPDELGGKEQKN